jgi:hypothetical protein
VLGSLETLLRNEGFSLQCSDPNSAADEALRLLN